VKKRGFRGTGNHTEGTGLIQRVGKTNLRKRGLIFSRKVNKGNKSEPKTRKGIWAGVKKDKEGFSEKASIKRNSDSKGVHSFILRRGRRQIHSLAMKGERTGTKKKGRGRERKQPRYYEYGKS